MFFLECSKLQTRCAWTQFLEMIQVPPQHNAAPGLSHTDLLAAWNYRRMFITMVSLFVELLLSLDSVCACNMDIDLLCILRCLITTVLVNTKKFIYGMPDCNARLAANTYRERYRNRIPGVRKTEGRDLENWMKVRCWRNRWRSFH